MRDTQLAHDEQALVLLVHRIPVLLFTEFKDYPGLVAENRALALQVFLLVTELN